jgi:23S rRNA (uracil1939-C5)-methyltransferase
MNKICMHFGVCGGCALQNLAPDEYRAAKRKIVTDALARVNLGAVAVEEPVIVPLRSRRRAVFKFGKMKDGVEIGFHAAKSHAIVDMRECLVLTPRLFDLAQFLRGALEALLHEGEKGEAHVTETASGFDIAFRMPRRLTPHLLSSLGKALQGGGIARAVFNKEIVFEQAKPQIAFGNAQVSVPPHAFLQATADGEAALRERVLALTAGAKTIADLFTGLGTFTLPLAAKARVHAVEQDAEALQALAAAARSTKGLKPVTTETRDLFKLPLTPLELKPYDAVVLDPPRAGAEAQVRALAAAAVPRIAYVSCDAASFARDAALLVQAGFTPGPVTPIDQFLFSGHIELVAGFSRNAPRSGSPSARRA